MSTNKLFKSCFLCLSVSISNDFELWSFLLLINFSAQKLQLGKKGVTLRAKFKAHAWLWSFFRCSNFFVVVNQNKGESKEKKRLNKRIKKILQRQTNPNKLPDFVCVYAFGQLFRAKSISRWPFLLWYKNKLPQNKIKFGFDKKVSFILFLSVQTFLFRSCVLLGNAFEQKCTFFYIVFCGTKKIFAKATTKRRRNRCLTLFCFNFVGHLFVERKLFSGGHCLLLKVCSDTLKPKFCETLCCFCSTFVPKPLSFSVCSTSFFLFFCWSSKKKKMNRFAFI